MHVYIIHKFVFKEFISLFVFLLILYYVISLDKGVKNSHSFLKSLSSEIKFRNICQRDYVPCCELRDLTLRNVMAECVATFV